MNTHITRIVTIKISLQEISSYNCKEYNALTLVKKSINYTPVNVLWSRLTHFTKGIIHFEVFVKQTKLFFTIPPLNRNNFTTEIKSAFNPNVCVRYSALRCNSVLT